MGPYVRMAFFCVAVKYDQYGNMHIESVYDRLSIDPFVVLPITHTLKLAVNIVRGQSTNELTMLGIRCINPDGSCAWNVSMPFSSYASPSESDALVLTPDIFVTIQSLGRYWIELFVQGDLLTRLPLSVERGTPAIEPQPGAVQ
jgi:Family of unknown function (DUF6941)